MKQLKQDLDYLQDKSKPLEMCKVTDFVDRIKYPKPSKLGLETVQIGEAMVEKVIDKYAEVQNGIPMINYKKAIKLINLMYKTGYNQNRTTHNTIEKGASPIERFKNSSLKSVADTASQHSQG